MKYEREEYLEHWASKIFHEWAEILLLNIVFNWDLKQEDDSNCSGGGRSYIVDNLLIINHHDHVGRGSDWRIKVACWYDV